MSKKILRKKLLLYRKSNYKSSTPKYLSLKKIINKFNYSKHKIIGAYYPINHEIDCIKILEKLERAGFKISLPVIKKNNEMDFFKWSFNDPAYIGKLGIPKPNQDKKVFPNILLVPLVAFDKFKYRLGYGGGYYDRYIQKITKIKKTLTIGLAFSFQEVNKLPTNNHDKQLDFILTESYIK